MSAFQDFEALMYGWLLTRREPFLLESLPADDLSGLRVLYPSLIPEPGTALLLGAGLAGLAACRRGRERASR